LSVDGFTSFRELQTVDLGDLELFVITGPTGAGKTSLLDSMALALYGQVPRMSGKSGLAELVSHGQAEARVMLEFSVDGEIYRVSRRLPRKGAQSARLERLEEETWVDAVDRGGVRAVNDKVQELLKLDFGSFCKAVILPQGEFARFLKGEPSERRETLVALLGLGSYERMRAIANERARELKIKTEQTTEILQGDEFADATPEGLAAAEADAKQAEDHASTVTADLTQARDDFRASSQSQEAATRAAALAERLDTLQGQLESEQTRCREAEQSAREARTAHQPAQELADRAAARLASTETTVEQLTAEHGSIETLTRLRDTAEALPQLKTELEAAHSSMEKLEEAQTAAATDLAELQARAAKAEEAVQAAEATRKERQQEHEKAAEACRALERQVRDLRDASTSLTRAEQALAPAREVATQEEANAAHARAHSAEAEHQVDKLQRANMVAALGSNLTVGDPCPICERLLEHEISPDGHIEAELIAAREAVESARDQADKAARRAAGAAARLAEAERAHHEALAACEQLASASGGIEAAEHSLTVMRAQIVDAAGALEAAQAAHEQAITLLNQRRQEIAAAVARVEGLEQQRVQSQRNIDSAAARSNAALAILHARFGDPVPADAAQQLAAGLAALHAAASSVTEARADERAARRVLDEATEAVVSAERRLGEIDVTLQELRGRAQAALDAARQIDTEQLALVLPPPAQARDVRAGELATWSRQAALQVLGVRRRLDEEAAELATKVVAVAASHGIEAGETPAALSALDELSAAAMAAQGSAHQRVASVSAQLEHRRRLEAQIKDDRARAEVLNVLARELRADRFIEFIIQETLDLLATRASDELRRISDGRYSLTSADGQFDVIDHLNADERRSVKTLSGGETFLASLALALALSQHVTDLAGEGLGARLEAVFIDEGFGALDPETLEEVIDALERLRDAQLIIGVISHVPEVAARIGEGLEVRRDGSRSVILDRKSRPADRGHLRAIAA
jgi:exonuclease SbcC